MILAEQVLEIKSGPNSGRFAEVTAAAPGRQAPPYRAPEGAFWPWRSAVSMARTGLCVSCADFWT